VDPSEAKKQNKSRAAGEDSFECVTREWFTKFSPMLSPAYAEDVLHRFEQDVFPYVGATPIKEVSPESVNDFETPARHNYCIFFPSVGGLIHTASGSWSGFGSLPLKRSGFAKKAASSVAARRA